MSCHRLQCASSVPPAPAPDRVISRGPIPRLQTDLCRKLPATASPVRPATVHIPAQPSDPGAPGGGRLHRRSRSPRRAPPRFCLRNRTITWPTNGPTGRLYPIPECAGEAAALPSIVRNAVPREFQSPALRACTADTPVAPPDPAPRLPVLRCCAARGAIRCWCPSPAAQPGPAGRRILRR